MLSDCSGGVSCCTRRTSPGPLPTEPRVPVIVAELGPDADPFMLHLYAALAEKEQRMISERMRPPVMDQGGSVAEPARFDAFGDAAVVGVGCTYGLAKTRRW